MKIEKWTRVEGWPYQGPAIPVGYYPTKKAARAAKLCGWFGGAPDYHATKVTRIDGKLYELKPIKEGDLHINFS